MYWQMVSSPSRKYSSRSRTLALVWVGAQGACVGPPPCPLLRCQRGLSARPDHSVSLLQPRGAPCRALPSPDGKAMRVSPILLPLPQPHCPEAIILSTLPPTPASAPVPPGLTRPLSSSELLLSPQVSGLLALSGAEQRGWRPTSSPPESRECPEDRDHLICSELYLQGLHTGRHTVGAQQMHMRERRKERGEALLQKKAGLAPDEGLGRPEEER